MGMLVLRGYWKGTRKPVVEKAATQPAVKGKKNRRIGEPNGQNSVAIRELKVVALVEMPRGLLSFGFVEVGRILAGEMMRLPGPSRGTTRTQKQSRLGPTQRPTAA